MELQLSDIKGQKIEVSDKVFSCAFNEPLIHQVVTAYLSAGRAGTKAQKNRAAVSGGGIKPWKQKGTGRARAGTIRSPIWRKGGVTFAAQPRSYEQKINQKMYRGALRSIISELIRAERLLILDSFALETHKTKDLLKKLGEFNLSSLNNSSNRAASRILVIMDAVEENLYLAARNLHGVEVRDVKAIDPAALVGSEQVLMTVSALKQLEELLK